MIGIYKITNPIGQIYIGQSKDIKNRFNGHGYSKHKVGVLNESFKTYGKQNHVFEVVEECEIKDLNDRERYWQDFYNVTELGLNKSLVRSTDLNPVGLGREKDNTIKITICILRDGKAICKSIRLKEGVTKEEAIKESVKFLKSKL